MGIASIESIDDYILGTIEMIFIFVFEYIIFVILYLIMRIILFGLVILCSWSPCPI